MKESHDQFLTSGWLRVVSGPIVASERENSLRRG